jgi:peptidylprolyl isomerase
MALPKHGDTVRVHYICRLDDGTIFENTMNRCPMQFKIGEDRIIPAFEQAIIGMKPGDSKTMRISAQAFGPYHEQLVQVVDRRQIHSGWKLELGQRSKVNIANGQTVEVRVTELNDLTVTIDGNHPLAGRDLTVDIQLVDIV